LVIYINNQYAERDAAGFRKAFRNEDRNIRRNNRSGVPMPFTRLLTGIVTGLFLLTGLGCTSFSDFQGRIKTRTGFALNESQSHLVDDPFCFDGTLPDGRRLIVVALGDQPVRTVLAIAINHQAPQPVKITGEEATAWLVGPDDDYVKHFQSLEMERQRYIDLAMLSEAPRSQLPNVTCLTGVVTAGNKPPGNKGIPDLTVDLQGPSGAMVNGKFTRHLSFHPDDNAVMVVLAPVLLPWIMIWLAVGSQGGGM
jgi:hypothetical protein